MDIHDLDTDEELYACLPLDEPSSPVRNAAAASRVKSRMTLEDADEDELPGM